MRLRSFRPADAAVVAGWPRSVTEIEQWCGLATVTAEVVAGWAAQDDVIAYALVDQAAVDPAPVGSGGPADPDAAVDPAGPEALVGYGELWLDAEEDEVELARLIVAPAHRGRGVGRRLVTDLAEQALRHHPDVFLRVHPDNAGALRSYLGAGFTPVDAAEAEEWNRRQPVRYVWLRYENSAL